MPLLQPFLYLHLTRGTATFRWACTRITNRHHNHQGEDLDDEAKEDTSDPLAVRARLPRQHLAHSRKLRGTIWTNRLLSQRSQSIRHRPKIPTSNLLNRLRSLRATSAPKERP